MWPLYAEFILPIYFIRYLLCPEIFIKSFFIFFYFHLCSSFFFFFPFLSFPKPFAFLIKAEIFVLILRFLFLSLVRKRVFLCARIILGTHGMKAQHKINSSSEKKTCCLKRIALESSLSSGRNKQNWN